MFPQTGSGGMFLFNGVAPFRGNRQLCEKVQVYA
jgi:hypothetical protein